MSELDDAIAHETDLSKIQQIAERYVSSKVSKLRNHEISSFGGLDEDLIPRFLSIEKPDETLKRISDISIQFTASFESDNLKNDFFSLNTILGQDPQTILQAKIEDLQEKVRVIIRRFQSPCLLCDNREQFLNYFSSLLKDLSDTQVSHQQQAPEGALKYQFNQFLSQTPIRFTENLVKDLRFARRGEIVRDSFKMCAQFSKEEARSFSITPQSIDGELKSLSEKLNIDSDLEAYNGQRFIFLCDQKFSSQGPAICIPPSDAIFDILEERIIESIEVDPSVTDWVQLLISRDLKKFDDIIGAAVSKISPRWGKSREKALACMKLRFVRSEELIEAILGLLDSISQKIGYNNYVSDHFSLTLRQIEAAASSIGSNLTIIEASGVVNQFLDLEVEFLNKKLEIVCTLAAISEHSCSESIKLKMVEYAQQIPQLFQIFEKAPLAEYRLSIEELKSVSSLLHFLFNAFVLSFRRADYLSGMPSLDRNATSKSELLTPTSEFEIYPSLSLILDILDEVSNSSTEICRSLSINLKKFSIFMRISYTNNFLNEIRSDSNIFIFEPSLLPFKCPLSQTSLSIFTIRSLCDFTSLELYRSSPNIFSFISLIFDLRISILRASFMLPAYFDLTNDLSVNQIGKFFDRIDFSASHFPDPVILREAALNQRRFNLAVDGCVRANIVQYDSKLIEEFSQKFNVFFIGFTKQSLSLIKVPTVSQILQSVDQFDTLLSVFMRAELAFLGRLERSLFDTTTESLVLGYDSEKFAKGQRIEGCLYFLFPSEFFSIDCSNENLRKLLEFVTFRLRLLYSSLFRGSFVKSIQKILRASSVFDLSVFSQIVPSASIADGVEKIKSEAERVETEVSLAILNLVWKSCDTRSGDLDLWKAVWQQWMSEDELPILYERVLLSCGEDKLQLLSESLANFAGQPLERVKWLCSKDLLLFIFSFVTQKRADFDEIDIVQDLDPASLRAVLSDYQQISDDVEVSDISQKVLSFLGDAFTKKVDAEAMRIKSIFEMIYSSPLSVIRPEFYSKRASEVSFRPYICSPADADKQYETELGYVKSSLVCSASNHLVPTGDFYAQKSMLLTNFAERSIENMTNVWSRMLYNDAALFDQNREKLRNLKSLQNGIDSRIESHLNFEAAHRNMQSYMNLSRIRNLYEEQMKERRKSERIYEKKCTAEFGSIIEDLNSEISKRKARFSEFHGRLFDKTLESIQKSLKQVENNDLRQLTAKETPEQKLERVRKENEALRSKILQMRVFGEYSDFCLKELYTRKIEKVKDEKALLCVSFWQSKNNFQKKSDKLNKELDAGYMKLSELEVETDELHEEQMARSHITPQLMHEKEMAVMLTKKSMREIEKLKPAEDAHMVMEGIENEGKELNVLRYEASENEKQIEKDIREPMREVDHYRRRYMRRKVEERKGQEAEPVWPNIEEVKIENSKIQKANIRLEKKIEEMERKLEKYPLSERVGRFPNPHKAKVLIPKLSLTKRWEKVAKTVR